MTPADIGSLRKLLRTIRMDPSDTFVFEKAAEPGEWAVTGTFLFAGRDIAVMPKKMQTAFRAGFAGVETFGFSTLAVVTGLEPGHGQDALDTLARSLVEKLGAPDLETARKAAAEELSFASELCEGHAVGTLIAMHRTWEDGQIRERFRSLRERDRAAEALTGVSGHGKAFFVVETDDDEPDPEENVDLIELMKAKR